MMSDDLLWFVIVGNRVTELNEKAPANIIITLVGNKVDLETDRKVSMQEADEFAKGLGLRYFEASAKMNIGIDDIFYETAKSLPKEKGSRRNVDIAKKSYEDNNPSAGACGSC